MSKWLDRDLKAGLSYSKIGVLLALRSISGVGTMVTSLGRGIASFPGRGGSEKVLRRSVEMRRESILCGSMKKGMGERGKIRPV